MNIEIRRGEIQGLIGENGSGKSTVTSIISGMQKADKGEMTFRGEKWEPASMLYALENGIGMIVQENGTVPGITVAENIFLGETSRFKVFGQEGKKCGPVNRNAMIKEAFAYNMARYSKTADFTGIISERRKRSLSMSQMVQGKMSVRILPTMDSAM